MANTIKTILEQSGVLAHVILTPEISALLAGLEVIGPRNALGDGIETGDVKLKKDWGESPIPGFDFALTLPTDPVDPAPYKLKLDPPGNPRSFQLWLVLAKQGQALFAFKFVKGVAGLALTGATRTVEADGTVLLDVRSPTDPKRTPVLVSRSEEGGADLGPALLIDGSATELASMRFTPDTDSKRGVITLGLEPPTVVFGDSKIGFNCPAFVIDDSEDAKADGKGAPALDPPLTTIGADTPSWRGVLTRDLDFYLPANVPLFGGHPIKGYFAIPLGGNGAELVIESKVPSRPATPERSARPGYSIRIECLDPTASGLSGLVPTLISATMELPLDSSNADFKDGAGAASREITFAAGKPVLATATFARDPVNAADKFRMAIGISARGEQGILSVTSTTMGGAKIFNTVAALATALIADKNIDRKAKVGETDGVVLYGLLAAGAALSSLFTDDSRFVLHGVEIEATGHGSPVGGPISLTLDYSVAVRITGIDVGVLSVSMSPDQPMRIRVRRARMSIDSSKNGLDMIGLDFDRAQMEIENPGAWNVEGLESLFDVLGSRSGRGSSWIEVDLRFKLNLGPIKVSGATIRAILTDKGFIEATIRGLEAGLMIPGAIEGKGKLQLLDNGFAANLLAKLLPLNVAADAGIIYAPPMIVLRLSVDLPAAIPLANSGFGLFGIGGLFGLSAQPDYGDNADPDPVRRQLEWTPEGVESFKTAPGQSTFGLFAAVGTLPDFGFSFSAKAGILITVPDIAVRGALNGRVLQPAAKVSDPSYPPSPGISFLGFIGVDAQALSFGVLGMVDLKPLLEVKVPLMGHFPFKEHADDWYVYLGADGYPKQGRSIGPISARVLPGILDVSADAYVMLRGKGIEGWPHGRALPGGPLTLPGGFVVAFGFSLQSTFGVQPIVWADLYASLDLMLGAKPPTLAGFGRAGGSLNLGPFSLGVQAQVSFMVSQASYFWAEVTGRIELFFFDIEGTVTISFGNELIPTLPDPDLHPLDLLGTDGNRVGSLGVLTDDSYRVVSRLVEDPAKISDDMRVWPDTIVSLPFAIPPSIKPPVAPVQFPGVAGPGATPPSARTGSEMLYYTWSLDRLELFDVTDEANPIEGAGVKPAGQLAAQWQVPRSSGGSSDVSELLLFSRSKDLWVNRVADAGKGNPENPLQKGADLCHRIANATPGWAIGFLASRDRLGFRLPPDPVSQNIFVSHVEVRMLHFGLTPAQAAITIDRAVPLPPPFSLSAARLVAWPSPEDIKHLFLGHLVAPSLRWLNGRSVRELLQGQFAFIGQHITLDPKESILEGMLLLVAERDLFENHERFEGLRVTDDTGNTWVLSQRLTLPTGEIAGVFRASNAMTPVRRLTVSFPVGRQVGIVGLGGITVTARDAATAENLRIAEEVARSAAAAVDGPKTDPTNNVAHQRAILAPGRLYRIDIDMSWSGMMFKQNESGEVEEIARRSDNKYIPKGHMPRDPSDRPSTNRRLFFRTTPKPITQAPVKYGHPTYGGHLWTKQDVFEPEMIERYLAGYDPTQSEEFRFCDDPLRAHFLQDHVAALAKAYDFDLKVSVRRVDAAGPAYASPLLIDPIWSFATDRKFLTEIDQIRYDNVKTTTCKVPLPGLTATINPSLEPEAWYDIHVFAKATNTSFKDGQLPGVTFKTSRWRAPADMFTTLGFMSVGESMSGQVILGDLAIVAPNELLTGVIEEDDQAFQNALLALGLDGWPNTDSPRLSRMWILDDAGGWRFKGLMVESPEPIHRPGRLELQTLTLEMGSVGKAVTFNVRRRDRSGSRVLYLTTTPFHVVTRERLGNPGNPLGRFVPITPQLMLTAKSILDNVSTTISGTLTLPTNPSFAEDP